MTEPALASRVIDAYRAMPVDEQLDLLDEIARRKRAVRRVRKSKQQLHKRRMRELPAEAQAQHLLDELYGLLELIPDTESLRAQLAEARVQEARGSDEGHAEYLWVIESIQQSTAARAQLWATVKQAAAELAVAAKKG